MSEDEIKLLSDDRLIYMQSSLKIIKNSRSVGWEWRLQENCSKEIVDKLIEMGKYAQEQSYAAFEIAD